MTTTPTNDEAHTEYIHFKCTPAFRASLQAASKRTGVPVSEIIRRAVMEYQRRGKLEKI